MLGLFDCCAGRNGAQMQMERSGQPQRPQSEQDYPKCGVGIVFASDGQGGLLVKGFVPRSTAQNGVIQEGDLLLQVDGIDVQRWPVSQIAPLMLGPPGSSVTLRFGRRVAVAGGSDGNAPNAGGSRPVPKLWQKGETPRNEFAATNEGGGWSTYDITLLRGQVSAGGPSGSAQGSGSMASQKLAGANNVGQMPAH